MIRKINNVLKERKVKMFLVFLLCSSLIWFIDNLSESYISNTAFGLEYVNVPDNLLLTNASKDKVDVKLQAVGFQFFGFNIKKRIVRIDLSKVEKKSSKFYILPTLYRKQIEKQLPNSMSLMDMDRDTLFFDFDEINSKDIPVEIDVKLNLPQNHILDGDLDFEPRMITITGPKNEIDTIEKVRTIVLELSGLTSNFSHTLGLYRSPELKHTTFSKNTVVIKGKVARFSEKIVNVPIRVINLPPGMQVRTFPDEVAVLCKAKLNELVNLSSVDFSVVADFNSVKMNSSKTIALKLLEKPKNVHSASLSENAVEYILKRE